MGKHGCVINGNWLIFMIIFGAILMYVLFGTVGIVSYIATYLWSAFALYICFIKYTDGEDDFDDEDDDNAQE